MIYASESPRFQQILSAFFLSLSLFLKSYGIYTQICPWNRARGTAPGVPRRSLADAPRDAPRRDTSLARRAWRSNLRNAAEGRLVRFFIYRVAKSQPSRVRRRCPRTRVHLYARGCMPVTSFSECLVPKGTEPDPRGIALALRLSSFLFC